MTELLIACNGSFCWYQWAAAAEKLSTSINIMHWKYYCLFNFFLICGSVFLTQMTVISMHVRCRLGRMGKKCQPAIAQAHRVPFFFLCNRCLCLSIRPLLWKTGTAPGHAGFNTLEFTTRTGEKTYPGSYTPHTLTPAQSQAGLHLTNSSWNVACSEREREKKQWQKWVREKRPEFHIPIGQSKRLGAMQHIFEAHAHTVTNTKPVTSSKAKG